VPAPPPEHDYDAVSIADLTQALNIEPPYNHLPDGFTTIMWVHTRPRLNLM